MMTVGELRKAMKDVDDEREVVVMINIDELAAENKVVACDYITEKLEIYISLYGLTIADIERGQRDDGTLCNCAKCKSVRNVRT